MTLNELVQQAHNTAKEKGWWDEERTLLEIHALIHSEVAEATESVRNNLPPIYREIKNATLSNVTLVPSTFSDGGLKLEVEGTCEKGKPEGQAVELADAFIRVLDVFGRERWDLYQTINASLSHNPSIPKQAVYNFQQNQDMQSFIQLNANDQAEFLSEKPLEVHAFLHEILQDLNGRPEDTNDVPIYQTVSKQMFEDLDCTESEIKTSASQWKEHGIGVLYPDHPLWGEFESPFENSYGYGRTLAYFLCAIANYFHFKQWDLEEAIKIKMTYNATRSHRHGGKKY